jgi:hypothetical protein
MSDEGPLRAGHRKSGEVRGAGRHVIDLPVGHCGQVYEDFTQVSLRIDANTAAGFDGRVLDGSVLAGFR